MHFDWRERAAIERRMAGPVFRSLSRALGRAIVARSFDPVADVMARADVDDQDLLFAVRCQGVAGHVAPLLAEPPAAVSAPAVEAIRAEARAVAARSAALADDLRQIAAAASQDGLACVPLKGTFLRAARDADPARRPSADVDLLIEPEARRAWVITMARLGYEAAEFGRHVIFTRPHQSQASSRGEDPDHPRPVEVHTRLAEVVLGREVDITRDYWGGVHAAVHGGLALHVPDDVALSLHLALHAAAAMLSRGLRLVQLLDLQYLAATDEAIARLNAALGPAAWAVMHLAERDVPGLVPRALVRAFDGTRPGAWRRRAVAARPGLLEGDPTRWRSLAGELTLSGPGHLVRRLRESVAVRAASTDPRRGTRGALWAARGFLGSLFDRRR